MFAAHIFVFFDLKDAELPALRSLQIDYGISVKPIFIHMQNIANDGLSMFQVSQ